MAVVLLKPVFCALVDQLYHKLNIVADSRFFPLARTTGTGAHSNSPISISVGQDGLLTQKVIDRFPSLKDQLDLLYLELVTDLFTELYKKSRSGVIEGLLENKGYYLRFPVQPRVIEGLFAVAEFDKALRDSFFEAYGLKEEDRTAVVISRANYSKMFLGRVLLMTKDTFKLSGKITLSREECDMVALSLPSPDLQGLRHQTSRQRIALDTTYHAFFDCLLILGHINLLPEKYETIYRLVNDTRLAFGDKALSTNPLLVLNATFDQLDAEKQKTVVSKRPKLYPCPLTTASNVLEIEILKAGQVTPLNTLHDSSVREYYWQTSTTFDDDGGDMSIEDTIVAKAQSDTVLLVDTEVLGIPDSMIFDESGQIKRSARRVW